MGAHVLVMMVCGEVAMTVSKVADFEALKRNSGKKWYFCVCAPTLVGIPDNIEQWFDLQ